MYIGAKKTNSHQNYDSESRHQPTSIICSVDDQENDKSNDDNDVNYRRRKLERHERRVTVSDRFQNLPSTLDSSFCREKPVRKSSKDVAAEESEVDDDRQQDEQAESVAPIQILVGSVAEEGVKGEEEVDVVEDCDQTVKKFDFQRMVFASHTTQLSLQLHPSLADVSESSVSADRLIGVDFRQIVEQVVAGQDHDDAIND